MKVRANISFRINKGNSRGGHFCDFVKHKKRFLTIQGMRAVPLLDPKSEIQDQDGKPTILRNDGGSKNNFITIKTVGIGPNRDALGARVKLVSGELIQWDEVRSGGSYLSSSDLRLHYGLGRRTSADLVEVHWPDGRVESAQNVATNQFVTMQEGAGIVKQRGRAATKLAASDE
jgi:ASPIC/UnbV protein